MDFKNEFRNGQTRNFTSLVVAFAFKNGVRAFFE